MYSVIYGVILDPFPYKDVDRLVSVQVQDPGRGSNWSQYTIDQFLDIAERNTVFQEPSLPPGPTSSGPATAIRSACAAITAP